MISFFRVLRRKLLVQNEFVRYLLYALGEIALIIVGILIALQVNNYNEAAKNKEIKRQLLLQLQQENQLNLTDLQEDQDYRDTLSKKVYVFHQFLNEVNLEEESEQLKYFLAMLLRGTIYNFSDKYLNKYITSYADDNDAFASELILLDTYQGGLEIISAEAQNYKMEKYIEVLAKDVDFDNLDIYAYDRLKTLEFRNNILILGGLEEEVYNIYEAALTQQMLVDSLLTVELR